MIQLPTPDAEFKRIWDFWKEYRLREHRFKYKSDTSEQTALNALWEKSGGDTQTCVAIIRRSAENGWKGLFALKTEHNEPNRATQPGTSEARISALKKW